MALFVIGDLHLALGSDKPMDIFPGWQGHLARLKERWEALVAPQDTVVVPGDVSWAMKLENTLEDFRFLHALPGRKLLGKGNHDYWWTTRAKMERFLEENGLTSLRFLHNNSFYAEDAALCGTRGWMFEAGDVHDEKIIRREVGRLAFSLKDAQRNWPEAEKIAFLHYPPVHPDAWAGEMTEILQEYGVKRCYYGHLHGPAIRRAFQGKKDGITYTLASADALGFAPLKIETDFT